MTTVRTDILGATRDAARQTRFEPSGLITETNVQKAIEQVAASPPAVVGTSVAVAASPYAVTDETVLYVDTSGGAVQILLPTGASRGGLSLVVKDVTGNGAANNITITPSGAETIDSLAALIVNADFGGYLLYPRTGSWTVAP